VDSANKRVTFDAARGRRYLAVAPGAFHPAAPEAKVRSYVTDGGGEA